MNLSHYVKVYPHQEDPSSVVLFSTKKAAIVTAPKSLIEDIERGSLPENEKRELLDLGFLVENSEKERREMLRFIDELNSIDKNYKAYVALNLDCNLACKYCFEGTRKGRFYMTKETADLLVDFVRENVLPYKDRITLVFYGGEPLLSVGIITYISQQLKTLADVKGIAYNFSFITNGTLLTRNIVEKLKPLGLKDASVTLDGPQSVHDLFRPFKTGKGSFDLIFRNVKDVCGLLDVQIGGNYTRENFSNFPELLDYCTANGLPPERLSDVRFDFVTNEAEGIAPPDFHDGAVSVNEPWLFEASLFLREEILKRGYRSQLISPGACMIEYKDRMVINYDGSIYKCPGLIGREDFKAGDLHTGIRDYRTSHNLDNWKNEECLGCVYLPLCFGGCRYMKLVRDGNMDGVDCKKAFLDATLETLVKQDIRYGLKA